MKKPVSKKKEENAKQKKSVHPLVSPKKPFLWIGIGVALAAVIAALCLLLIPPTVEISASLDACIVSALKEVYHSDRTEGKYPAVAYTVLGAKESGDTVTVYGVMLYREYTCTQEGDLKMWGSDNGPFSVTAVKQADGSYEATACWFPEGGKNYASSIRDKFPLYCEQAAINAHHYFADNDQACSLDVSKNLSDADKYVVMESERDNVYFCYSPTTAAAYIQIDTSVIADGRYTIADNTLTFTSGETVAVFAIDGNDYIFNAEKSQKIPTTWTTDGDEAQYLTEGTRFTPAVHGDSAPVGNRLIVHSPNWTTLDEIQEMFGYVPNDFTFEKSAYLPIKLLKSRGELDWLLASHMEDTQWTDLKQETFTQFDEAFFENNALVMVYYNAPYAAYEPQVTAYKYTEDGTCLSVRLTVKEVREGDTVVGQWLLFSGIKKSDLEGIKVLEAYVEETTSDATTLSFTGKVKQVEGNAVLMECDSVPQFSSGVWVELGDAELDPMVGETYVVTYEDIVMPSLPPRITAVTITKP